MENFHYQPIVAPDEIRMLELSPGATSDPIQVRLIHKPLSHMPQCIALSYEWGSPTRDFEIICDGALLKVTKNLVTALKRLRTLHVAGENLETGKLNITERTLFWVDAISINQEDLDERSEQVPLMSSIFKNASWVIVWLGEERAGTSAAWNLMIPLSEQADKFDDLVNDDNKDRYESMIVGSDLLLKDLPQHPAWGDIMDIFASRTKDIPLPKKNFEAVLVASLHVLVTDQRDRVLGVLGLFDEDTRSMFANVGYHNTPGEISRIATEAMMDGGKGLNYLLWIPAVPPSFEASTQESELPSWVWMLEYRRTEDHFLHNGMKNRLQNFLYVKSKPTYQIQGDEILTQGMIFDTVTVAYPNISPENFEGLVLDIQFSHEVMVEQTSSTKSASERTVDRLRSLYFRTARNFNGEPYPPDQYDGWIARIMLRGWERERSTVKNDSYRGLDVSVLRQQAALGHEHLDGSVIDKILRHDQDGKLTGEGRNIFVTSKVIMDSEYLGRMGRDASLLYRLATRLWFCLGLSTLWCFVVVRTPSINWWDRLSFLRLRLMRRSRRRF
ncbi:hypothetical protein ONS95_005643 [Cadophora gregata]|uniref:uncharacterized protein n=1 Tax=Cadophora gregata TaxID=51156 RepID=UPI0026DC74FB|nr:uncharacterized protein ONS95_005643 [Cadophora gregata]KAK0103631.1 hypothetical protein ONS95_005643 [Cadophora gregata]KAK0107826.1 hypothetical protein ONS96_003615 [Cadophora gregata f. sp. sojae]